MLYTGIDYHRKYSVLRTLDASGTRVKNGRIEHDDPQAFAAYCAALPEISRVVMEACWNWGWLYDLLGDTPGVEDAALAHPYKTRLIADAQIKTDGLDTEALATLLRGNLIATAHAPSPAIRPKR
jgi:hypothetical protein